jgi:hypothetical protein
MNLTQNHEGTAFNLAGEKAPDTCSSPTPLNRVSVGRIVPRQCSF